MSAHKRWCFNGDGGTTIATYKVKKFSNMTEDELIDLAYMPEPGSFVWAMQEAKAELKRRDAGYKIIESSPQVVIPL